MTNKQIKNKVVYGMLVRLTFDGAFQRSKIYGQNASDERRKEFRNYMSSMLPETFKAIRARNRYTD